MVAFRKPQKAQKPEREFQCEFYVWTRAPNGYKVRVRGLLKLDVLMALSDAEAGEVVRKLIGNAMQKVTAEVEDFESKQPPQ